MSKSVTIKADSRTKYTPIFKNKITEFAPIEIAPNMTVNISLVVETDFQVRIRLELKLSIVHSNMYVAYKFGL